MIPPPRASTIKASNPVKARLPFGEADAVLNDGGFEVGEDESSRGVEGWPLSLTGVGVG